ncbi:MAG: hypothetical protein Q8P72_06480 [Candidatus Roizmanbacteria bacterium]|nr:hypothetical protein [Candidatus Roizmanbacteria bacterium]
MSEDIKFIITTTISLAALIFAFWQYKAKKEEEKKVEALKVLLGTVKGWREYIQSAANANTLLRNHIRGTTDENKEVTKFTSLDDVESTVEINGVYLNGLHIGVQKELEEIVRVLKEK